MEFHEQQFVLTFPEADLGMFSMFGRTGAPTKMGPPHEGPKKFCNVPTENDVCVCHFKQYSVSFCGLRPQTPTGPCGRPWGPHIFSEQGPVGGKSGPEPTSTKVTFCVAWLALNIR